MGLFENAVLRRIYGTVRKERKSEGKKNFAKEGRKWGIRLEET